MNGNILEQKIQELEAMKAYKRRGNRKDTVHLTVNTVRLIKQLIALDKYSYEGIAKVTNSSPRTIRNIANKRVWANIE